MTREASKPAIAGGQIRHILTFVGGMLVSKGVFDEDMAKGLVDNLVVVIGAISFLAGALHSIIAKKKAARDLAKAAAEPPH